jgi:hypothetical protein
MVRRLFIRPMNGAAEEVRAIGIVDEIAPI